MSEIEPIKYLQQLNDSASSEEPDIEEYNRDIETAMNEMDNRQFTSHDEAIKLLLK